MSTTTKLSVYDTDDGGQIIGTLELADLAVIQSIGYGKEGSVDDSSHVLRIYINGVTDVLIVRAQQITNTALIQLWCDTVAQTPQAVSGSRDGNVALASLLTALVSQGLIIDNTTI